MWGTVSEVTVNLPPLLIVPGKVVGNDLPYNFEIFGKFEVISYFLTLRTVFDIMKKHFHWYFRLNSHQWFKHDGLNTPAVSSVFFPSMSNLQETIGFLVYVSSGYTDEHDFRISEEKKISMTIKKKRHNKTNGSHLTQLEEKSSTLFSANSFFAKELFKARQYKAQEKCSTTEKSFLEVMEKGKRERRGKLSGIKEWKTWKTESSWFESGWEII